MKQRSDEELIVLSRAGDKDASGELWQRYKRMVCAYARKCLLFGGDTEDLIQEGMIGFFSAVSDYALDKTEKMSFKNFAYLCIKRQIADEVKKTLRRNRAPSVPLEEADKGEADYDLAQRVIDEESRSEFWQRIGRELSDFEFRIIVMYLDGLSYAEIAEATKRTVKSVDNAISRSKKKLLKIYGNG